MVSLTLEIETTRDIARQMLRHRSFSFQEYSQRYADPTKDLNFVVRDARKQDQKNRQNSVDLDYTNSEDRELDRIWKEKQQGVIKASMDAYKWAISNGIAKEQARAVLPEGNMESRLYMAGTLRSWIHYIQLRSENGTQKEHIEVAKACAEAISKIFPLTKDLQLDI
jgi:thymidylate synthase (FAD)